MENLSTSARPLNTPSQESAIRVLVLGAGVIGLTTAWSLLDRGFKVTVVAKDLASEKKGESEPSLSSEAAGALWKCLPLECGPQAVTANLEVAQKWTLESYKVYTSLASDPTLGGVVELQPCTIVTTGQIEGNPILSNKLEFVKKNLSGFRLGSQLFEEYGINEGHAGGLTDVYEYTAPVINVGRAMEFLQRLVEQKGATIKRGTIRGDLLPQESALLREYDSDVIINTMGLGAGEAAADDKVYGLHGALLRIVNDGSDFPVIKNATIVSSTKVGESGGDGAFILPRQDGVLALGTISTGVGSAADLTVNSETVEEMRQKCVDLLPQLKNARVVADNPIVQGTRPQRHGGARVEREARAAGSRIIHSYGHGGAGWSLSIGSAQETARLVEELAAQLTIPQSIAAPSKAESATWITSTLEPAEGILA
ncbi:FAD dependent oxidoreductase family protein [Hypoxylon sp. FL1150]|nr:FAD dependent oxidoreductase family protein [Hypoxylon sp. FL1150]